MLDEKLKRIKEDAIRIWFQEFRIKIMSRGSQITKRFRGPIFLWSIMDEIIV